MMRNLGASIAGTMLVLGSLTPASALGANRSAGVSAAQILQIGSFAPHITEAAGRFGLPPLLIGSVIAEESAGDATAISPKGAMGLMQLMPKTYSDMSTTFGLGPDPFNPRDNIIAGSAYLRLMLDRYGESGFLAAYNAGPARYEAHLKTGSALPRETANYVADVELKQFEPASHRHSNSAGNDAPWQSASLFVAQIAADEAQSDNSTNIAPNDANSRVASGENLQAQALFASAITAR